ncbi:MAG: 4-(cytidine 5'-diphospho)-2-C-methyl-D-erythritol kinase [Bacteroidaceae bacterium]|nr:4-(cytidine 5'-diphospho)-2-C-methyl-D-erythritol kinase [Bacteroidaceae bacterium]
MIAFPNAKINIGLNVVGKRPDGYHDIETVFYPVNVQDVLEINVRRVFSNARPHLHIMPDKGLFYEDEFCSLTLKGELLPGNMADNLVVRAYRMLLEDFDLPPIDIMLYKHIPSGAGLGGGSSDCANMIMLLNRRFGLRMTSSCMQRYAARLGADCAFFVLNKPVLATGIGDVMSPLPLSLKGYTILIVKPDVNVSTKEAYSLVVPQRPQIPLEDAVKRPITEWKDIISNDFEKSIFSLYPEVGELKSRLYDAGAVYAAMSGSGSAVYGIFEKPLDNPETLFAGQKFKQRALL